MAEISNEIFPNPPVKSVSCEIRFPTLLTIKETIPAFQAIVRNEFPDYFTQTTPRIYKSGVIDEISWNFKSNDDTLNLKIKTNTIVLTSSDYNEFEPYYNIVKEYFENFFELNELDKFLRIGLRYTNREEFDDKEPNLSKLLRYFNFNHFKFNENDKINNFSVRYNKIENEYYMNIVLDYGKDSQGKYSFLFDFDSYSSKEINKDNYINVLDKLHKNILKIFYEKITENYKNEVLRVVE